MIDRATIEKIKEAANIVDVVSEFVTLKKVGANYRGLCPFHNEKTPSFYVSPSRGTCHCFGCGKGGDSVGFIMEHEQMTYPEALRWLANKYHIEIHERELSDEEKREQSERESMFIVNEWATSYFEHLLHNDADGLALGLQYFRSRGFRDDIIKRYRLGYDLADRHALSREALGKGYKEEYLLKTGICYRNDRGELIDRYAGRVIFPWVSTSGKVLGFSARVLDSRTKGVEQKYVNSPGSEIFQKGNELYGLYQAKGAISKEDRVYLVEGQADVISLYQNGIQNVVAGSGTALTFNQIHALHRFTSNVTLVYDDDAAGIHAALKGTDMMLQEGMNLKVLLLPDGDDPDSFARKHTPEELHAYFQEHETDFIEFKTRLLLEGESDPLKRSDAINSIVSSIALVQNQILRDTYVHDCSTRLGIAESTLINTMNRFIRENRGKTRQPGEPEPPVATPPVPPVQPITPEQHTSKVERMLMQLIVRFGEQVIYDNVEDDDGNLCKVTLAQFVSANLAADNLKFNSELYNRMLAEAEQHSGEADFKAEQYFIQHPDMEVSRLATQLSVDRYQLIVEQAQQQDEPKSEEEQAAARKEWLADLARQTNHLLMDFRMGYVEQRLDELKKEINASMGNSEKMMELMRQFTDMQTIRNNLAKELGNNIIA